MVMTRQKLLPIKWSLSIAFRFILRFDSAMTFIRFFFSFFLLFALTLPSLASAMSTEAKQAIITDMETGQVLFEKNKDMRMPTSSMSKVMSMYVVFDALQDGRLKLDDEIEVSEKAWQMGGSKMFIEVGKKVKVEDLVRGVIVQSGNDATVALAEALSGTEESFGRKLTEIAKDLGMENSNFVNASGWPDDNHYSTAEDLAILAKALITDFPDYYHYYAEKEFEFNEIKQPNRNPLLYRNIGADGIKTGHTEAGGYGLMASGARDGRRVIMVLNGMESEKERAEESAKLLDWALREFENKTLFKKNETIEVTAVQMGKEKELPLVIAEDLKLTLPKGAADEITAVTTLNGPVVAPIKAGDKIGMLTVSVPNLGSFEREVLAGKDIEELGFFAGAFERMRISIKNMLDRQD